MPSVSAPSEPTQPTTQVPVDPFPGKEVLIQVSTGKTHFVISNRGGVIKQLQLPRFNDDSGEIIDLIDNPDHLTPALALRANDPEVTAILQHAHYEPSTTSIVLSEHNPEGRLTMTLNHSSGLQVTRTYVFHFNDYMVEMGIHISAAAMASRNLQYQVVLGPGMGGKISSQTDYIVFSGATVFANNERIENPPEDITSTSYFKGDLQWVSFQNKYFGSALIPQQGTKSGVVFKEKDQAFVGLELESVQSAASAQHLFYAGTKELEILEDKGHKLVRMIDYGWFGNKFAFLVKPLLKVLAYFYGLTGNYGWSIIFMTCIIKLLFFPLTHKSFKSMKGMQKVQPYVKIIQERNKDDRKKMNEEMMELYKKHKVNPRRVFAHAVADSRIYRPLSCAVLFHRASRCPVHGLGHRPFRCRPLLRFSRAHGSHHVRATKTDSIHGRPHATENHDVPPHCLHLPVPYVSGRTRHLLDG